MNLGNKLADPEKCMNSNIKVNFHGLSPWKRIESRGQIKCVARDK
jgi:hypothetical protein